MLTAIPGPPHAAALESGLGDGRRLDGTASVRQAHGKECGVTHPTAVVAEVLDGVADDLAILAACICQLAAPAHCADRVVDSELSELIELQLAAQLLVPATGPVAFTEDGKPAEDAVPLGACDLVRNLLPERLPATLRHSGQEARVRLLRRLRPLAVDRDRGNAGFAPRDFRVLTHRRHHTIEADDQHVALRRKRRMVADGRGGLLALACLRRSGSQLPTAPPATDCSEHSSQPANEHTKARRRHRLTANRVDHLREFLFELARDAVRESTHRGCGVWLVATCKFVCGYHLQTRERLHSRSHNSPRVKICPQGDPVAADRRFMTHSILRGHV